MEIFQQSPSNQLEIITDFHKMRQAILSLGMKADPYWHLGTRLLTQNMGGWPKHDLHQLSALYRGHTSENLFQGSLASLAVCISIYIQMYVCVSMCGTYPGCNSPKCRLEFPVLIKHGVVCFPPNLWWTKLLLPSAMISIMTNPVEKPAQTDFVHVEDQ